jgi:hypothetical protein
MILRKIKNYSILAFKFEIFRKTKSPEVTTLADFAYILNTQKSSISYAKTAFKNMLGTADASGNFVLSKAGQEVFDVIRSNSNLKTSLFGLENDPLILLADFKLLLSSQGSSFYNFIK